MKAVCFIYFFSFLAQGAPRTELFTFLNKPDRYIPYCYILSRELNFAKMERAYFAGLEFRDLATEIRNLSNLSKYRSALTNC